MRNLFGSAHMIVWNDRLTTAAVDGDEESLSILLRGHDAELRGRLADKIAPRYRAAFDVDDVLQVTYLEAFLRIAQFNRNGSDGFLAWLTRIAEHNLTDAIRALDCAKRPPRDRQIEPQMLDDRHLDLVSVLGGTATSPSHHAAKEEAKGLIDAAIDRLPPDYGKVVRMYDLEGRPVSEVANALKRSDGAVHMLKARAHDRLVELLGESTQFFFDERA